MIICLFGDEVRFYFIVLRPACSASRCRRLMTVPAKQTTPSAPCRLRTIIKVDWSERQEARMYLCDYLLDKWWLWRTSDFHVTLVRHSHSYSTSYKNLPGCTKANVKRAASTRFVAHSYSTSYKNLPGCTKANVRRAASTWFVAHSYSTSYKNLPGCTKANVRRAASTRCVAHSYSTSYKNVPGCTKAKFNVKRAASTRFVAHSYSTSYKNLPGCTKANVKRAASTRFVAHSYSTSYKNLPGCTKAKFNVKRAASTRFLAHSYSTSYKNLPGCTKANVKRAASMHTRRVTRNNFLEECEWLYAQVAFFGFPRQVFRGFKSQFASLTVRMLPRVSSGSVDRKGAQAKIHKLITRCRVANVFRREFSVYKPLTDDFPKVQTFLSNILIMSRSLLYAENCVKISST